MGARPPRIASAGGAARCGGGFERMFSSGGRAKKGPDAGLASPAWALTFQFGSLLMSITSWADLWLAQELSPQF